MIEIEIKNYRTQEKIIFNKSDLVGISIKDDGIGMEHTYTEIRGLINLYLEKLLEYKDPVSGRVAITQGKIDLIMETLK